MNLFDPPTVGSSDNSFFIANDGTGLAQASTYLGIDNVYFALDGTADVAAPEPSTGVLMPGTAVCAGVRETTYFLTRAPGRIKLGVLMFRAALVLLLVIPSAFCQRPDGLYTVIQTSKGKIVARLEPELTPMTVANFVGLAEGTISNAAFDPGKPFYDGSAFHRVVPGHVIQTGLPKDGRAPNPGYMFPNEIHARLNHGRAGMLNMANGGPNTNAAQWCITLGDRSYLDGDYIVFGQVVEGLDVVMKIVQGDIVESVRIERVGVAANAFHPTEASFRAMVRAAEANVAEHEVKKRAADAEWIQQNYPKAVLQPSGVLVEELAAGKEGTGPRRVQYRGTEARYMGRVIERTGPLMQVVQFGSDDAGVPRYVDPPKAFDAGIKVGPNGVLDSIIAEMKPGERRVVVIPAALGYGKGGLYPAEIPGQKRFAISPYSILVYDLEVLDK